MIATAFEKEYCLFCFFLVLQSIDGFLFLTEGGASRLLKTATCTLPYKSCVGATSPRYAWPPPPLGSSAKPKQDVPPAAKTGKFAGRPKAKQHFLFLAIPRAVSSLFFSNSTSGLSIVGLIFCIFFVTALFSFFFTPQQQWITEETPAPGLFSMTLAVPFVWVYV